MDTVRFSLIVTIYFASGAFGDQNSTKTQMTRTSLHVARSLDPDSMETMPIRTRNGELTNILVKKRNGRERNTTDSVLQLMETMYYTPAKKRPEAKNSTSVEPVPSGARSDSNATYSVFHVREHRSDDDTSFVPVPVTVKSTELFVKPGSDGVKKGRGMVRLDHDGIPVVTGVRVPDDETDRHQIWRNARVINGMLVPYDKSQSKKGPTKLKPTRKPLPENMITAEDFENGWLKITSTTAQPLFQKITYNNNQPLTNYNQKSSTNNIQKPTINRVNPPKKQPINDLLPTAEHDDRWSSGNYKQHPSGIWVPEDNGLNKDHNYVADKILDYIRNINREEMKRLSVSKFTSRDARKMNDVDQPVMQSRILHLPGHQSLPNSALYSPSTVAPSRLSFEEGVRTPVLQYAHPEYGVQSAKITPTDSEIQETLPPNLDLTKEDGRREQALAYFAHDIYADRSPFAIEPGATREEKLEPEKPALSDKRSHQRPKKTLSYFNNDNTYHSMPPTKFYSKYSPDGSKFPTALYYEDNEGKPFWIKISDTIKEHVQSGIEKVSDMTRPVMEPLVEATHKISHNLGLTRGNRDFSTLREKLGVAAPSSLILPAIGIVAGGAALGLGAVAVGRYLNYDVVRMRGGKSLEEDFVPLENIYTVESEGRTFSKPTILFAVPKSMLLNKEELTESATTDNNTKSNENRTNESPVTTKEELITVTDGSQKVTDINNSSEPPINSDSSDKEWRLIEINSSYFPESKPAESNQGQRKKRSVHKNSESYFENMIRKIVLSGIGKNGIKSAGIWDNTPCSKMMFCESMLSQKFEAIPIMEKKINKFMSLLPSNLSSELTPHLEDVMTTIKSGDCSRYECSPSTSHQRTIGTPINQ